MGTASIFGLIFAALSNLGRPNLVFAVNAVSCKLLWWMGISKLMRN
jgi:hypothetical protein